MFWGIQVTSGAEPQTINVPEGFVLMLSQAVLDPETVASDGSGSYFHVYVKRDGVDQKYLIAVLKKDQAQQAVKLELDASDQLAFLVKGVAGAVVHLTGHLIEEAFDDETESDTGSMAGRESTPSPDRQSAGPRGRQMFRGQD